VVAQFAKELVRMDQVKRAEGKSKWIFCIFVFFWLYCPYFWNKACLKKESHPHSLTIRMNVEDVCVDIFSYISIHDLELCKFVSNYWFSTIKKSVSAGYLKQRGWLRLKLRPIQVSLGGVFISEERWLLLEYQ
jgi:hypothetical protein